MRVPSNLEVFASHGSAKVPDKLSALMRPEFGERLRKNFSDWATKDLIADIPEGQRLCPKYGRIAGDPNRALDSPTLFRTKDFGDIEIFQEPIPEALRQELLDESYRPYHREALRRIVSPHGNPKNGLLIVDVHDTGNLIMREKPDDDERRLVVKGFHMPPVILSSCDGRTSSPEVMEAVREAFVRHLGLSNEDVRVNDHYHGGYFTQRYGGVAEDTPTAALAEAAHQERQVVQVELGRELYMDEKTQKSDVKAVAHYRKKLAEIFSEVANGIRA